MFNPFNDNTQDIQFLLDNAGKDVLINDTPAKALITNPSITEYEEKYISTLQRVSRGDIVAYDNEKYISITESTTKRHGKYKALMRHCNYDIELPGEETCIIVGYDELDRPIYECTYGDPIYVSSIVDNKSFSVDGQNAINVPENEIIATLQDNQSNRDKLVVNNTFTVMSKTWTVLNQDLTKNGLLILTCEITLT